MMVVHSVTLWPLLTSSSPRLSMGYKWLGKKLAIIRMDRGLSAHCMWFSSLSLSVLISFDTCSVTLYCETNVIKIIKILTARVDLTEENIFPHTSVFGKLVGTYTLGFSRTLVWGGRPSDHGMCAANSCYIATYSQLLVVMIWLSQYDHTNYIIIYSRD